MMTPPATLPDDVKPFAKRIQVLPGPHLSDFYFYFGVMVVDDKTSLFGNSTLDLICLNL